MATVRAEDDGVVREGVGPYLVGVPDLGHVPGVLAVQVTDRKVERGAGERDGFEVGDQTRARADGSAAGGTGRGAPGAGHRSWVSGVAEVPQWIVSGRDQRGTGRRVVR